MIETLTKTQAEDAIAGANDFMEHERGIGLDGAQASETLSERVVSVADNAQDLLEAIPDPRQDGFYVPLSKQNANSFDLVSSTLVGYIVLVPSQIVDSKSEPGFYPAVISEDGLKNPGTLRLHVLKRPYRKELNDASSVVLSAAGQSETKGIGDHGHKGGDGVEAEHFATLLAAGSDADVRTAWQNGVHINHQWRKRANDSVLSEVNGKIFGKDLPQQTVTLTREQFAQGKAQLLWHEGMRDVDTGQAETATRDQALVVIQALGHEAIASKDSSALDDVKRMLV